MSCLTFRTGAVISDIRVIETELAPPIPQGTQKKGPIFRLPPEGTRRGASVLAALFLPSELTKQPKFDPDLTFLSPYSPQEGRRFGPKKAPFFDPFWTKLTYSPFKYDLKTKWGRQKSDF